MEISSVFQKVLDESVNLRSLDFESDIDLLFSNPKYTFFTTWPSFVSICDKIKKGELIERYQWTLTFGYLYLTEDFKCLFDKLTSESQQSFGLFYYEYLLTDNSMLIDDIYSLTCLKVKLSEKACNFVTESRYCYDFMGNIVTTEDLWAYYYLLFEAKRIYRVEIEKSIDMLRKDCKIYLLTCYYDTKYSYGSVNALFDFIDIISLTSDEDRLLVKNALGLKKIEESMLETESESEGQFENNLLVNPIKNSFTEILKNQRELDKINKDKKFKKKRKIEGDKITDNIANEKKNIVTDKFISTHADAVVDVTKLIPIDQYVSEKETKILTDSQIMSLNLNKEIKEKLNKNNEEIAENYVYKKLNETGMFTNLKNKNANYMKVEAVYFESKIHTFLYNAKEKIEGAAFDVIDEDANFEAKRETHTFNSSGLGVVVYMDWSDYCNLGDLVEQATSNSDIHFKFDKDCMLLIMKRILTSVYKISEDDISNIFVAHEHGFKYKKCHYQIAVFFTKQIKRNWCPASFAFDKQKCILMYQNCKKPNALKNYVRKDGDFCCLKIDNSIMQLASYVDLSKKNPEVTTDIAATIMRNSHRTKKELIQFLGANAGREFTRNYTNFSKFIDDVLEVDLPPFEWVIPSHIQESSVYCHQKIRDAIIKNFINCPKPEPGVFIRTKALVLYGPQGCGKTEFAKSLVNHEAYYIHSRNLFTAEQFKNKPHAKLLIIDDHQNLFQKTEQLKALLSGQPTAIREAYMSIDTNGFFCVVCTNQKSVVSMLINNELLTKRCVVVEIPNGRENYLGPPWTWRDDLHEVEHYIGDDLRDYVEKKKIEYEEKKDLKKELTDPKEIFKVYLDTKAELEKTKNLLNKKPKPSELHPEDLAKIKRQLHDGLKFDIKERVKEKVNDVFRTIKANNLEITEQNIKNLI